uniref:EOG090X02LG n=1 Tax=Daphnia barbata TaxID=414587 RepID=A0A4Y7LX24_9CRUS|nr:EOG090X02LG [Daphnia barbata]
MVRITFFLHSRRYCDRLCQRSVPMRKTEFTDAKENADHEPFTSAADAVGNGGCDMVPLPVDDAPIVGVECLMPPNVDIGTVDAEETLTQMIVCLFHSVPCATNVIIHGSPTLHTPAFVTETRVEKWGMADIRLELQLSHKMIAMSDEHDEPVINTLKTKKNQRRKSRSVIVDGDERNEEANRLSTAASAATTASQQPRHKIRHHRAELKHEVHTLRKMVKTLASEQHDLQKQMVLLSQLRTTAESNVHKIEAELMAVLKRLDSEPRCSGNADDVAEISSQNKKLAETVDRLSLKVSGVDQVQSSTLQLFEAMERLEERYDDNISELQREVAKLEYNDGQLTSTVHTLREDQGEQLELVKSMRTTTTLLQEQVQADQIRSALLLAKLTNNTLAMMNQSHGQQVQNWRLAQLEQSIQSAQSIDSLKQSLAHLEHEYNNLAHNLPHDCRDVSSTGVNYILPRESSEVVKVYCDQETSGGGWTVIQRRADGKEDFNRNWAAYKSGFGSVLGEFWLGNDNLHRLTKENTTMLRVDLWDIYGQYWWAEYDSFLVANENEGYAVQFHGYTGNASDAMASYHQSMKFSTRDNDQDLSNTNCADSYQGGWWYSHCQHVNINGKYALGLTWYDSLENEWIALAKVEMKVRDKRIFNQPTSTTAGSVPSTLSVH